MKNEKNLAMAESKEIQLLNSLKGAIKALTVVSSNGVRKDVKVVALQNIGVGTLYDKTGNYLVDGDMDNLHLGGFSGMVVLEEKVHIEDHEENHEENHEGSQSMPYRFGEYCRFDVVSYSEEDGFELKLVEPVIVEKL